MPTEKIGFGLPGNTEFVLELPALRQAIASAKVRGVEPPLLIMVKVSAKNIAEVVSWLKPGSGVRRGGYFRFSEEDLLDG